MQNVFRAGPVEEPKGLLYENLHVSKERVLAGRGSGFLSTCRFHERRRSAERLLAHIEMTASWIQGRNRAPFRKAQLTFRAAEDKWSVIDTLEHLNLAEPIYWKQFSGWR